jgi:cytochrome c biogenesis protein CcmG, thiol:disulfide interchange protein DsbE
MKTRTLNRAARRRLQRANAGAVNWKILAAGAITVLLVIGIAGIVIARRDGAVQSASEAPIYAPLQVGGSAPPFALTTIDGHHLDSAAAKHPILLELFATWCPHCQRETATLNAVQDRLGKSLSIVAVSASKMASDRSSPSSLNDVRAFARYYGARYPIAFDPGLVVAKRYLQGGFPTIIFIDSAKRVTAIETGEVSAEKLLADARRAGAV